MIRPEFSVSCDNMALGQMYHLKMNRSMSNLPSIKIDEVDEEDEEYMGHRRNVPVRTGSLQRSSYKSVLPRKFGRFRRQQVSQVSPQSSCERLTVERGEEMVRGRERERRSRANVWRSKVSLC